MKKVVTIFTEGNTYEFKFEDMIAQNESIVQLAKVNCSLQDKIDLFNAGIATCFSKAGSIYIDITKAKYICFELRK